MTFSGTCLGNAKRSIIVLFVPGWNGNKTTLAVSLSPLPSSRALTGRACLSCIQPENSFLVKCVLGRKICFISANPAGLPGGPPTVSTSVAHICWPTEGHHNEVSPFLHASHSTRKTAVGEAGTKEVANEPRWGPHVTCRSSCRLAVLQTVPSAVVSLTWTYLGQIGLCDCYHMLQRLLALRWPGLTGQRKGRPLCSSAPRPACFPLGLVLKWLR